METIELVESPNAGQIQPIVDGVVSYGKSQVKETTQEKFAFHLKVNGALVGGIVGAMQYDRFYLSHIWVSEKHRNKGFGSSLLNNCEEKMRRVGCNSIMLETLNKKAVALYFKHGYVEVGNIPEYVKGFDLIHMVKKI